jgi:hypothetical protein
MALRVVIIFSMTATMTTLDFLSVAVRRLWKALRAGLLMSEQVAGIFIWDIFWDLGVKSAGTKENISTGLHFY